MQSKSSHDRQAPFLITAAQVFDGETMLGPCAVEIAADRIVALHRDGEEPSGLPVTRLPDGALLAPGFIDLQVNGGGGVLLNDAPCVEAIRTIATAHRRYGITGLLSTLITDIPERMAALADCATEALAVPGVLGFHLEGPFLNPARKGIHPVEHIREPDERDVAMLARFGGFGRSMATLAPERLAPGLLERLVSTGLRIAIGHSEATGAQVEQAVANGATGVTHLFNAMSQMMPREPGIVGQALADDRLFTGLICDGLHVAPATMRAAFRAKGPDRLMLVSDAMPLVGSEATEFKLNGRRIGLDGGRLTDAHGTLAGAHLTMIDAVWNAVRLMGATLAEALVMASLTPARFLGLADELGRITAGYRADLVAFTGREVIASWISGRR